MATGRYISSPKASSGSILKKDSIATPKNRSKVKQYLIGCLMREGSGLDCRARQVPCHASKVLHLWVHGLTCICASGLGNLQGAAG
jgi:acetyl-CoA acetyltransferase